MTTTSYRTTMDLLHRFGEAIEARRLTLDLSKTELARKAGVSPAVVGKAARHCKPP